jgi:glycerophosphoryl diester phosphodiesterase
VDDARWRVSGRPLVLGHRGAPRVERENTVEAFRRAVELGADGVELDVRRTADGALVVHHDAVVEGVGPIVAATAARLAGAAPWVPTLADALAACAGALVNVEIKNFPGEPDWDPDQEVGQALPGQLGDADVVVSSFLSAAAERVREVAPGVATGLLVLPGDPRGRIDDAVERGHDALHPCDRGLDAATVAAVVARCHDAGLRCHVWTVDDPERMRLWAGAGVDALITNVPDVARATVG